MADHRLLRIDLLEAHAIRLLREVAAESARPAILHSPEARFQVLLRLAEKAFYPGKIPFRLLTISPSGVPPDEAVQLCQDSGLELLLHGSPGSPASKAASGAEDLVEILRATGTDAVLLPDCSDAVSAGNDLDGQSFRLFHGRAGADHPLKICPLSSWTGRDLRDYALREGLILPSAIFAGQQALDSQDPASLPDSTSGVALLWNQPFRFPIAGVVRTSSSAHGYAGQIAAGAVAPGQEVIALPSMVRSRIKEVGLFRDALQNAPAPLSVVLTLEDAIELDRGDMLADPAGPPVESTRITIALTPIAGRSFHAGARALFKHTSQTVSGAICGQNPSGDGEGIGIALQRPIYCDLYGRNPYTGSVLMIDPRDGTAVAEGRILSAIPMERTASWNTSAADSCLGRSSGLTVWLTGLSGAGKTTISREVATELSARGLPVELIDGDVIRKHLSRGLGFSKQDRDENIRRIAFVAQLLTRNGAIVLVSAISPYQETRAEARRRIGNFLEVYVNAPLDLCEKRDPKDLYKRARSGDIHGFTGVDDPYEPPPAAEITCFTGEESVRESSLKVIAAVLERLGANLGEGS